MDYEKTLLAAFFVNEEAYDISKEFISDPNIFDDDNAKDFWRYITKNKGKVDPATAINDLPLLKDYIKELMFAETIDPEISSKKVVESAAKREIKNTIVESQLLDDPFEMLAALQSGADKVNDILNYGVTSTEHITELITEEILAMSEAAKQKGLVGVPSGFKELDKITGGWQDSDLIIVAGRPAMGKTAFMLTVAREANVNVGIASLEMSKSQLTKRVISASSEVELGKVRDPKSLTTDDWKVIYESVENEKGIYITDTPAMHVNTFRSWARKMNKNHDCKLFIVDYLQLMKADAKSREQEISTISRTLKQVAKELNCPVISLAQLNRKVEERQDKRPTLGDLRESGAIEQDADIITFLYRPAYYGLSPEAGEPVDERFAELIIGKHRNGSTGAVSLRFMGEFVKFLDYDNFAKILDDVPF